MTSTTHSASSKSIEVLNMDGSNFLTWKAEMSLYLTAKGLFKYCGSTPIAVTDENKASIALATLEILQSLSPLLKRQYINATEPNHIWISVSTRFGDLSKVLGPTIIAEWNTLRFSDFKSVALYTTALMTIVEKMTLCKMETLCTDDHKIQKTLTTFPIASASLAMQYSNMKFTKFTDLLTALYMGEQHQLLLEMNSNLRPSGQRPGPESSYGSPTTGKAQKKTFIKRKQNQNQSTQRQRSNSNNSNSSSRSNQSNQSNSTLNQNTRFNAKMTKRHCWSCGNPDHLKHNCTATQAQKDKYTKEKEASNEDTLFNLVMNQIKNRTTRLLTLDYFLPLMDLRFTLEMIVMIRMIILSLLIMSTTLQFSSLTLS
jgi:hypothetical protein